MFFPVEKILKEQKNKKLLRLPATFFS